MSAIDRLAFKVTRPYREEDLPVITQIWNEVVEAGNAFPQTELLTPEEAREFFAGQSRTTVATMGGKVMGLYILHPNNVGRCGHIANASYAVARDARGSGIGQLLVEDSLRQAGRLGFRGLQFNAVVASNQAAISLYEKLGFQKVGTIIGGFRNKNDVYEDMHVFFHETQDDRV